MNIELRTARPSDIDTLLQLYREIYGNTYPLEIGTHREKMHAAIVSNSFLWIVAESQSAKSDTEPFQAQVVGSCVLEMDKHNGIGKIEALAVSPAFRKSGVAQSLVEACVTSALNEHTGFLDSIYATTRTLSVGPQLVLLHAGFLPLGIFPNAHRLKEAETLTLVARFRPGVLERRLLVQTYPPKLEALLRTCEQATGLSFAQAAASQFQEAPASAFQLDTEFEIIFAERYVKAQFEKTRNSRQESFYPFHTPNLLLTSPELGIEVFCLFQKSDGYCTIVSISKSLSDVSPYFREILKTLRKFGMLYSECLVSLANTEDLEVLLAHNFIPSALYPAMLETPEGMMDHVLLSRTLEPLHFRGLQVEKKFQGYIKQYIEAWQKQHLEGMVTYGT